MKHPQIFPLVCLMLTGRLVAGTTTHILEVETAVPEACDTKYATIFGRSFLFLAEARMGHTTVWYVSLDYTSHWNKDRRTLRLEALPGDASIPLKEGPWVLDVRLSVSIWLIGPREYQALTSCHHSTTFKFTATFPGIC